MAEYIAKEDAISICMQAWDATDASQDIKDEPPANVIEIPEGATNGDMIKAMFPNAKKHESTEYHNILFAPSCHLECCNEDWWNSPYRKEWE